MAKTSTEKLANIDEEMRQLANRRKVILQQHKAEERKARTKRLIERGAILESMIDEATALTNEQVKFFLEKTIRTEFAKRVRAELTEPQVKAPAEKRQRAPEQGAAG